MPLRPPQDTITADALVASLGLPKSLPHLEEALTHPSFSNEQRPGRRVDNQRLEFLGDAVLGLCVSEILMDRFPAAKEGELSIMRAALVNTDALAAWARSANVGAALRVGRGADAAGERDQKNVLADAVEALVAAVYLSRGPDGARKLVEDVVREPLKEAERLASRDPKSLLQELVQGKGLPAPVYRVRASRGPQHDPVFEVEVVVDGQPLGVGEGRSKRLAERAAAQAALDADEAAKRAPVATED